MDSSAIERIQSSTKRFASPSLVFTLVDKSSKLKLLDVGALDFHYKDKWIEAIAIDLNSNHSQVLQVKS